MCAVGILSACDVTIKDGDIQNVSVRANATREWNRHYSLAQGGRVEIINNNDDQARGDSALAASARSGDTAAFSELWRRHAVTP